MLASRRSDGAGSISSIIPSRMMGIDGSGGEQFLSMVAEMIVLSRRRVWLP
jgi:hypothetical protein